MTDSQASEFAGKGVVVVNGAEGIGAAIVAAFLERGSRVAVGVTPSVDGTDAAMPSVASIPLRLQDSDGVTGFFDRCEAAIGGLDVLVMAARPVRTGKLMDLDARTLRSVVEDELVGVALCMQEAARRMLPRRAGRIISLASMSGKTGVHTGVAPYAAAKGGLIAFSRVMAAELAASGVTVNVIATALFEPQVAVLPPSHRQEIARGVPVGRFGQVEEAAHAVLYLASRHAGYVTGETLNLSGGRFMD